MNEHPVVGPLFSSHVIEEAVLATLKQWLPGYLNIACELYGVTGGIAAVKSWAVSNDAEKWPEQGLPALLVVGPDETTGDPDTEGQGMYRATWPVEVGLVIAARTRPGARKIARIYGAAIRGALLQRRSLGVQGLTTTWHGEGTGIVDSNQSRTLAANANLFQVTVDRVVSWRMGPGEGKPPIPDDWPEVTETEIETEIEP